MKEVVAKEEITAGFVMPTVKITDWHIERWNNATGAQREAHCDEGKYGAEESSHEDCPDCDLH